jgi:hypothetical protein
MPIVAGSRNSPASVTEAPNRTCQVAGTAYGYVNGSPQTIVAKKGYAVSGVQVQSTSWMYGLQVDFMKRALNVTP